MPQQVYSLNGNGFLISNATRRRFPGDGSTTCEDW